MNFTKFQLAAVYKLGQMMMLVDGKIEEAEKQHLIFTFSKLSAANGYNDFDVISQCASTMEDEDVVPAIVGLEENQKAYVVAFMGVLAAIDGDIADNEMKLYNLTCKMCGLQPVPLATCIDVWKKINNL